MFHRCWVISRVISHYCSRCPVLTLYPVSGHFTLRNSCPHGHEVLSHCCLGLFLWWLVLLSFFFSCVYWITYLSFCFGVSRQVFSVLELTTQVLGLKTIIFLWRNNYTFFCLFFFIVLSWVLGFWHWYRKSLYILSILVLYDTEFNIFCSIQWVIFLVFDHFLRSTKLAYCEVTIICLFFCRLCCWPHIQEVVPKADFRTGPLFSRCFIVLAHVVEVFDPLCGNLKFFKTYF